MQRLLWPSGTLDQQHGKLSVISAVSHDAARPVLLCQSWNARGLECRTSTALNQLSSVCFSVKADCIPFEGKCTVVIALRLQESPMERLLRCRRCGFECSGLHSGKCSMARPHLWTGCCLGLLQQQSSPAERPPTQPLPCSILRTRFAALPA